VLASLIAFPVAYLMMQEWLADFVYRAAIHFDTFILAAILVVIIALFTVSFQALKAALANPVKALRYE
jgi:putative ABC transport system permease protein